MSTAPETPSERGQSEFDPEIKGGRLKSARPKAKPAPEGGPEHEREPEPQPEPAKRSWLDGFGQELRARYEASQEAVAAIPRPVALATAAILIVPATLGFLAAAYIGGVQQKLGISLVGPDGVADAVTALWWSNRADQFLVVGTQSGRLLELGAQGNLREQSEVGAPIVDIADAADALPPMPVTLSPDQLTATPSGSLGRAGAFGIETCRSGYVWREATIDDLVCVPPDVRDQALADRAEAEAGRNTAAGCAEGLVPRNANPNDTACTTPEIAADILEQNQRHESRKLLPGSAFAGARRVQLPVGDNSIEGERGLFAVVGTSVIAGERATIVPDSDAGTKQAVETAQPTDVIRLAQWTLADGAPARASEVGTLEDVRVLAQQPGTDVVYAGDGTGTVYTIDASIQMSGTNPTAYMRELGFQGSPITAISVASAPAGGMPSLVTAAENGAIEAWWPGIPAPSRALDPPALSRPVMSRGSVWALQQQTTIKALTVLVKTAGHGDALLFSSETSLSMLAAPSIEDTSLPAGAETLMPPFATTPDGHRSAGYDPATGAVITYEGIIHRPLRSIPVTDTPRDIALSPAGDRVAIVRADGSAEIASLADGDDVELSLPPEASSAAFNPSGTQLALGLEDTSAALIRSDGTLLDILNVPEGLGDDGETLSFAPKVQFASKGRQLVLLEFHDAVLSFGIRNRLESISWNPSIDDELTEGKLTANGKRLIFRRGTDELVVYDVTNRTELASIFSPGFTTWAASPDVSIVAVTTAGGGIDIYVEQPDDTVVTAPPRLAKDGLKLSADGSRLLVRDIEGKLHLWDLSDQAETRPLGTNLTPDLTAIAAELAPDGRSVVVADSAGGIYLIDLPGLYRIGIAGHGSLVPHLLLSADGRLLASASLDGVVQITDLARVRQIGALPLVTAPIGRRPERLQPTLLADQPGSIDPAIQQFLESAGYGPVPIDGVLGIATRAAIARWQLDNALPPTGVLDDVLRSQAAPARQSAS